MLEEHPLWGEKQAYLGRLRDEKRLLESSLKIYETELNQLLRDAPRPEDIAQAVRSLRKNSPATATRKLIIWRAFLNSCPQPWRGLLDDIPHPKIRRKEPRFLTEQESFLLESAAYHSPTMTRDRLFLACGLQLGLRLSEILSLKFENIEGNWLRIRRKGDKEQRLPLTPSLKTLFQFWKTESFAKDQDWVFPGRTGEAMSARGAQKLLDRLRKSARIQKKITPHSLRHTFATTLAAKGANLVALKEILGHEKITTTERYLHVTPEHLRETVNLIRS